MKKLISFLKSRRFYKLVVSSFAILFVLVNTACSQPSTLAKAGTPSKSSSVTGGVDEAKVEAATTPKVSSPYRKDKENTPEGQITELYRPIQPATQGMNTYSDIDPRQDTTKASQQAKKVLQNSARQPAAGIGESVDRVKQELKDEPIGERMEKLSKRVGESAQSTAEGVSAEARKGLRNIDKNSKNFGEDVKSTAKDMSRNVQRMADNAGTTVKETTDVVTGKS
ncbi:hypothetical protein [Altericista sp. CCNU0014]|uniref:hypothetical protein n=1 Tax=Altericista sp. CCNU0014 TaxID=3082949 RepID=UPI0038501D1B